VYVVRFVSGIGDKVCSNIDSARVAVFDKYVDEHSQISRNVWYDLVNRNEIEDFGWIVEETVYDSIAHA